MDEKTEKTKLWSVFLYADEKAALAIPDAYVETLKDDEKDDAGDFSFVAAWPPLNTMHKVKSLMAKQPVPSPDWGRIKGELFASGRPLEAALKKCKKITRKMEGNKQVTQSDVETTDHDLKRKPKPVKVFSPLGKLPDQKSQTEKGKKQLSQKREKISIVLPEEPPEINVSEAHVAQGSLGSPFRKKRREEDFLLDRNLHAGVSKSNSSAEQGQSPAHSSTKPSPKSRWGSPRKKAPSWLLSPTPLVAASSSATKSKQHHVRSLAETLEMVNVDAGQPSPRAVSHRSPLKSPSAASTPGRHSEKYFGIDLPMSTIGFQKYTIRSYADLKLMIKDGFEGLNKNLMAHIQTQPLKKEKSGFSFDETNGSYDIDVQFPIDNNDDLHKFLQQLNTKHYRVKVSNFILNRMKKFFTDEKDDSRILTQMARDWVFPWLFTPKMLSGTSMTILKGCNGGLVFFQMLHECMIESGKCAMQKAKHDTVVGDVIRRGSFKARSAAKPKKKKSDEIPADDQQGNSLSPAKKAAKKNSAPVNKEHRSVSTKKQPKSAVKNNTSAASKSSSRKKRDNSSDSMEDEEDIVAAKRQKLGREAAKSTKYIDAVVSTDDGGQSSNVSTPRKKKDPEDAADDELSSDSDAETASKLAKFL